MLISFLIVTLVLICGLYVLHGRQHRAAEVTRKYKQRLTLQLSPVYREKVEEDRRYELAKGRLELDRQKFALESYLKLHHVSPETYIVNAPIVSSYAFPSLKRPEVRIEPVERDEDEPALPPPCRFSDLLASGFEPTMQTIYLGALAGDRMIAPPVGDLCHIANAGATGGGKSVNIRLVMVQLCYVGAQVVLLNPHFTRYDLRTREDWTPIEARLATPPVRDFAQIGKWLRWASSVELRRRLDRYERSQPWGAPLFLVVEELPAITKHVPDAIDCLADILREGRKVEIYLIIAAQDVLVKTIGGAGALRDCFRTALYVGGDATTARVLLDVKGTVDDGGLGKGIVMMRTSQNKQAALARIPYVDNEALYSLLGPSTFDRSQVVDAVPDENIHSENRSFSCLPDAPPDEWMNEMNEPVKPDERPMNIQISDEERAKILGAAQAQLAETGKVVRTKIRDALGWNNAAFPKIKQVLDEEGL